MAGNREQKIDPSSGRPIMRDIVPKQRGGVFSKLTPSVFKKTPETSKEVLPDEDELKVRIGTPSRRVTSMRAQVKTPAGSSAGTRGFLNEFEEKKKLKESGFSKRSFWFLRSLFSWRSTFSLSRHSFYWSVGIVVIFIFSIIALRYFSYVIVRITPKQETVEVSSTIRASVDSKSDLALDLVNFEDSIEISASAVAMKKIEIRAKGMVVIFNAFNTETQLLVSGTRFESPNGNIYRIQRNIIVPGAKLEGGKIIPEGVEAEVVADKAGEAYNLGLSDFTIPGFKGTPRYNKFYARSKTEISGGYVGDSPIVTQELIDDILAKAKPGITDNLKNRVSKDLPSGIFLPPGASDISVEAENINPPIGSRGEKVSLTIRGTFTGLAFKEKDVFQLLGKTYLNLPMDESVSISNWENLSITVISKSFPDKTITFSVKGKAHFIWEFDGVALKNDLIASRADRKAAFGSYKSISRAEIDFRPPWWRIFPKDSSRIKIERLIEEQN